MYFLDEHPAAAASWKDPMVKKLLSDSRVNHVIGDMCMFSMKQNENGKDELVKKPTGFMTNAEAIALRLARRCND